MEERRREFIAYAGANSRASSILTAAAHMERERLEGWTSFLRPLSPGAWDQRFEMIYGLADNRDFVALDMLVILARYRDHDMLPRELVEKAEAAILAFKYWYTDGTPAGLIDDSYYWSENHQIVYHTVEYLAGQLYSRRMFGDGRLGVELVIRAAGLIDRWINLRVRFGFSEWHSNVYYQKDLIAMLALAELAEDERLATRAAMVADLLLLDLALHTREATMGVTHGRSEKDDQSDGRFEATWGAAKFVFGQASESYSFVHPDAFWLTIARRYRIPEVIYRIGRTSGPFVSRESMGIPVPEDSIGDMEAPVDGLTYDDVDDLAVWWGMGAHVNGSNRSTLDRSTGYIRPVGIKVLSAVRWIATAGGGSTSSTAHCCWFCTDDQRGFAPKGQYLHVQDARVYAVDGAGLSERPAWGTDACLACHLGGCRQCLYDAPGFAAGGVA